MTPLLAAAATGFGTAFSLILAIGAQNAFVLRQGLRREHVFIISLICAVSDALLITAGVLGFGAIVDLWPAFPVIMRYAGAAFLIGYALLRFHAAWQGEGQIETDGTTKPLMAAVLTCLRNLPGDRKRPRSGSARLCRRLCFSLVLVMARGCWPRSWGPRDPGRYWMY